VLRLVLYDILPLLNVDEERLLELESGASSYFK
jgi:hypothetical protein